MHHTLPGFLLLASFLFIFIHAQATPAAVLVEQAPFGMYSVQLIDTDYGSDPDQTGYTQNLAVAVNGFDSSLGILTGVAITFETEVNFDRSASAEDTGALPGENASAITAGTFTATLALPGGGAPLATFYNPPFPSCSDLYFCVQSNQMVVDLDGTYPTTAPLSFFIDGMLDFTLTKSVTLYLLQCGADDNCEARSFTNQWVGTLYATYTYEADPLQVTRTPASEVQFVSDPNTTITFRVDNLSATESVTLDALSDSLYGDLDGQGTCSLPQSIAIGGFYACEITAAISGAHGDVETGTVTAEGTSNTSSTALIDTDTSSVTLTLLDATRTATPDTVGAPGAFVAFGFEVANVSSIESVTIDTLSDSVLGDLHGQGTCAAPQVIAPGSVYTCSVIRLIEGFPGDSETSVFTASGTVGGIPALATSSLSVAIVAGGEVITPTAVWSTSQWSLGVSDGKVINLINGSGLSGTGSVVTHVHDDSSTAATMWTLGMGNGGLGGPTGNPPPVASSAVVFDLGELTALSGAYIWNHNQRNLTYRGLDEFEILVSTDSNPLTASFSSLGTFELAQASGQPGEPSQPVVFSAPPARLVKFALISVHSGSANELAGLSEVRFVPEPGAGIGLVAGGMLLVGLKRRRDRTRASRG